uniref:Uncharacterized protein n=1 Tax=Nelumbo nucifera TaxID=4432 RepID=A0A822YXE7_NELNU|nr:TPA_asm: hypothetical protein HUJ06_013066 [Nelumbo nucifera]
MNRVLCDCRSATRLPVETRKTLQPYIKAGKPEKKPLKKGNF